MKQIIFYCITEAGNYRALRSLNEGLYEPIIVGGKVLQRKTLVGLSNALCKHVKGSFGLKQVL